MTPARDLQTLLTGIVAAPVSEVRDVVQDSREVTAGALFLACRGRRSHGLRHLDAALAAGAGAVLWEPDEQLTEPRVPAGIFAAAVPGLTPLAGEIASRFFGAPSVQLQVTGITGTNGKTTCAWLLAQALQQLGTPAGYSGTLGAGLLPSLDTTAYTTPDASTVQRQLARLRDAGATCVAMEVSSHALDQDRVAGVRFRSAAFTNLTREHLDYHLNMQAYGAAKARLFAWPSLESRVINADDAFGRELGARRGAGRLLLTARELSIEALGALAGREGQWLHASELRLDASGMTLNVRAVDQRADLRLALIGEFNADNALTVLGLLYAMGHPLEAACAALAACCAPPGRMQVVGDTGALIVVDYAHTPDALRKALRALRAHCSGRLSVVFGCGGDRDAGKRPLMGAVAAELADRVTLTDDNPRSEAPAAIAADIARGLGTGVQYRIVHDRAAAIGLAMRDARPGDVVLVAGKGHETEQVYGDQVRAFSDADVVRSQLGAPH